MASNSGQAEGEGVAPGSASAARGAAKAGGGRARRSRLMSMAERVRQLQSVPPGESDHSSDAEGPPVGGDRGPWESPSVEGPQEGAMESGPGQAEGEGEDELSPMSRELAAEREQQAEPFFIRHPHGDVLIVPVGDSTEAALP